MAHSKRIPTSENCKGMGFIKNHCLGGLLWNSLYDRFGFYSAIHYRVAFFCYRCDSHHEPGACYCLHDRGWAHDVPPPPGSGPPRLRCSRRCAGTTCQRRVRTILCCGLRLRNMSLYEAHGLCAAAEGYRRGHVPPGVGAAGGPNQFGFHEDFQAPAVRQGSVAAESGAPVWGAGLADLRQLWHHAVASFTYHVGYASYHRFNCTYGSHRHIYVFEPAPTRRGWNGDLLVG
mmetsp:Transcript_46911/g.91590  ORF Transcript_46911/g.91590 Transcript_46911/m.91590 type:complete len:231 (+) Transcript_46911:118-810(+)